jgi:hypothetical protein
MAAEERYRFLVTIEEILGISISNQDAVSACTILGLAKAIAGEKGATPGTIAYAKSFLLLRRSVTEVLCVPQHLVTPSTIWDGYLPKENPRACRQLWRRLQQRADIRLPALRGPRWPWIAFDVLLVPMAPLCYIALGSDARAIIYSVAILAISGLPAFGVVRLLANRAPHITVGDSAKYLAEMTAESAGVGDYDWTLREMQLIVREIVGVELDGACPGEEIPFQHLAKCLPH